VLENKVKQGVFVLKVATLEQGRRQHKRERESWAEFWFFLHENQSPMHAIYSNLEWLRSSQQLSASMAGFKPTNHPKS
jgi:hypothetical protein